MDAETVSLKSTEQITRRGYCFWRCEALRGEIIAIVKDGGFYRDRALVCARHAVEKGAMKEMPTIYTLEELRILCESDCYVILHEAKKAGGVIENTT